MKVKAMYINEISVIPVDYMEPDWSIERHEWKVYIAEYMRLKWDKFTPGQKEQLAKCGQYLADMYKKQQ